jgi:glycine C-acetyltransferase
MFGAMKSHIAEELKQISAGGLYKAERIITSPQDARITIHAGQKVLNLCSNNYLGLAGHPAVIRAAQDSYAKWGYGLSSVRFICGTQQVHKQLEKKISEFLGTEDTILYSCCFDANTGLFETLLAAEDAVISDETQESGRLPFLISHPAPPAFRYHA